MTCRQSLFKDVQRARFQRLHSRFVLDFKSIMVSALHERKSSACKAVLRFVHHSFDVYTKAGCCIELKYPYSF